MDENFMTAPSSRAAKTKTTFAHPALDLAAASSLREQQSAASGT